MLAKLLCQGTLFLSPCGQALSHTQTHYWPSHCCVAALRHSQNTQCLAKLVQTQHAATGLPFAAASMLAWIVFLVFRHRKFVSKLQQLLIWTAIWLTCVWNEMSWSYATSIYSVSSHILWFVSSMFMAMLLLLRFVFWAPSYPKHWKVLCFIWKLQICLLQAGSSSASCSSLRGETCHQGHVEVVGGSCHCFCNGCQTQPCTLTRLSIASYSS